LKDGRSSFWMDLVIDYNIDNPILDLVEPK
jgi:hypothetical protein